MALTLKDLKAKSGTSNRPEVKIPDWDATLYVRKIPGKRGVKIIKLVENLDYDDGELELNEKTIAAMHATIAAALVNEAGEAILDNEEGIALLEEQDVQFLTPLFKQVAVAIGLFEPEKNVTVPSCEGL